ncbi:MAG: phenylacetate--CoA ligase family protein [Candidatus Lokiarchaeia archaeon]
MSEPVIFGPRIEMMPRDQLKDWQMKLLQPQLKYVYAHSSFFRKRFDEVGVKPGDVESWESFERIPVTTAEEIMREAGETGDSYGGLLCKPSDKLTLANTTLMAKDISVEKKLFFTAFTPDDLRTTANLISRTFYTMGIRKGDLVQMAMSGTDSRYITAGVAMDMMGVTRVSTCAFMLDAGRAMYIAHFHEPDFLIAPVDFALSMANAAEFAGIDPKKAFSSYRAIALTEQALGTENTQKLREKGYVGEYFSMCYTPEACFWAIDCKQHSGIHAPEDLFVVEAVDPKTGKRVKPGEKGNLTITSLYAEATPLIRYQTSDTVTITEELCRCGRTTTRITYYN